MSFFFSGVIHTALPGNVFALWLVLVLGIVHFTLVTFTDLQSINFLNKVDSLKEVGYYLRLQSAQF